MGVGADEDGLPLVPFGEEARQAQFSELGLDGGGLVGSAVFADLDGPVRRRRAQPLAVDDESQSLEGDLSLPEDELRRRLAEPGREAHQVVDGDVASRLVEEFPRGGKIHGSGQAQIAQKVGGDVGVGNGEKAAENLRLMAPAHAAQGQEERLCPGRLHVGMEMVRGKQDSQGGGRLDGLGVRVSRRHVGESGRARPWRQFQGLDDGPDDLAARHGPCGVREGRKGRGEEEGDDKSHRASHRAIRLLKENDFVHSITGGESHEGERESRLFPFPSRPSREVARREGRGFSGGEIGEKISVDSLPQAHYNGPRLIETGVWRSGSALAWHARGRGFESPYLHQKTTEAAWAGITKPGGPCFLRVD